MRYGAIWDFDGTLFDSMNVWSQIDVEFLGRRGFEVPDDYQEIISPMQSRDVALYTIERFGLSDSPDALMEEWYQMAKDAYCHTIQLKPGAKRYLEKLAADGIHLAIATSSYRELVLPALKRTGIDTMFETIITAEEVASGKTSPQIYLEAAERMQVEPGNCYVYEDLIEAVRTAKSAGFRTAGVYDSCSHRSQILLKNEADRYIESFEDCMNWKEFEDGKYNRI